LYFIYTSIMLQMFHIKRHNFTKLNIQIKIFNQKPPPKKKIENFSILPNSTPVSCIKTYDKCVVKIYEQHNKQTSNQLISQARQDLLS